MIRGVAAAALGAALAFAPGSAAAQAEGSVGAAAASARAAFAADVREAESVLAEATRSITAGFRSGAVTRDAAAQSYAAAFCFFAGRVAARADAAADAFAADASQAILQSGDPELRGTLAGGGGSVDALAASLQSSLEAVRRASLARARRFGKSLASGTARTRLHVVLPAWRLAPRAAPSAAGAVQPGDATLELLAAVAVRLDSGRVVVGLGGRAPAALDGDFDARLVGASGVRGVGPLLSAGGIDVADGAWVAAAALNDPTQGESVEAGNRSIQFGVDPYDGGLAGRQPGRLVQAGVIGVP